jgi:hypothetical protein
MGTWGSGVFDSDLALDLRADVTMRLARGASVKSIVDGMLRRPSIFDDPDDGVVVLFALAETLHDLGRVDPRVAKRADDVLARGEGGLVGAGAKLAKARARELERLRGKLSAPPPRPKKLTVPKRKETRLREGDVIAFEARRGRTLLFLVESVGSAPSGTYPELVQFDWCGAAPPTLEVVERLALRFGWRQHSHLGEARIQARYLVGDMSARTSAGTSAPRYEVIGEIAPAQLPLDGRCGGIVTDVALLGAYALEELSPQRYPRAEYLDSAAAQRPPKERDEARRVGLALGAILHHLHSTSSVRDAKRFLEEKWDVRKRRDALLTLWELLQYGDSFDAFRMFTPQGAKEARSEGDDRRRQLTFARANASWLKKKLLLAWDLGRASHIASSSRVAGYITDDELQGFLVPAVQRARATYASWKELGEHFCLGREYRWNDAPDHRAAAAELLADRKSPWRTLRFR